MALNCHVRSNVSTDEEEVSLQLYAVCSEAETDLLSSSHSRGYGFRLVLIRPCSSSSSSSFKVQGGQYLHLALNLHLQPAACQALAQRQVYTSCLENFCMHTWLNQLFERVLC